MSPPRVFGPGPNKNNGFCECGCGNLAPISTESYWKWGWIKGQPKRFLNNHDKTFRALNNYREEDRGYSSKCWIWQGPSNKQGYGRAGQIKAHQFFYRKLVGNVPPGLELDHRCRVVACCNPAHLEPVSRAINVQRGNSTRLKPWQVQAMRRAREECGLSYKELARAFGVGPSQASRICRGASWKNLQGDDIGEAA